jgi:CBS domain containing-hemolysin-like protein
VTSISDWWPLLAAVAFVLLAALFAAAEVALSRVSRIRVEELVEEGRSGAVRLQVLMREPARPRNLLLLLRLVCEISASALMTVFYLEPLDGAQAVLAAVGTMTLVGFVVIGVATRTLGRQHAERIAIASAVPVAALTALFGPIPSVLILIGNALTPGKGFREGPFASEAELRDLVGRAQRSGVVEASEREMIESVFELGDTIVREVMVPRTYIVVIERGKSVKQALNLLLRSGFSRIPVVGGNTDDVLGVVYLKDLVKKERSEGGASVKVEDVMRTARFIPESKPVDELLKEMQAERGHIAVVVDEYGGTAGLVTLEDLVEEVVGEITDEYDREAPPVEALPDGSLRVTARLPVEDLEERYGVSLPHEDVDTVGGLMASLLGRVPIPGATITVNGLVLVAESAKGRRNRIGTVLVCRVPDQSKNDLQEEKA